MPNELDFEQTWLAKFYGGLNGIVGAGIRKTVMEGSEKLTSGSSRREVIDWSKQAMERLDSLVDEEDGKAIMTGCACQYPKSDLQAIRKTYETTGNVSVAHQMLQEQFESFLRETLALADEDLEEIVAKGWGTAGVMQDNTIVATKIPKSEYLVRYLREEDPGIKREYYCHCPRVRDILKISETISQTYCYCGAGFYKGIWEEILQETVDVEVVTSVLKGDDVCSVVIHLPEEER